MPPLKPYRLSSIQYNEEGANPGRETDVMAIFLFTIRVTPGSETELKEVAAPDFVAAVQTLAEWRPGIHIVKLEGVYIGSPAYA